MPKKPEQEPCPLWQRLTEGLKAKGLDASQTAVAGYAHVNQTSARKWMYGGPMTLENGITLAKKAGLAVEYLLTGKGPKRPWDIFPSDLAEIADFWEKMPLEVRAEVVSFAKYKRSTSFTGDETRRTEYQEQIGHKEAKEPR